MISHLVSVLSVLFSLTANADTKAIEYESLSHPQTVTAEVDKVIADDVNCPCFYLDVSFKAYFSNGIGKVYVFADGNGPINLNVVAELQDTEEVGFYEDTKRFGPFQEGQRVVLTVFQKGSIFGSSKRQVLGVFK